MRIEHNEKILYQSQPRQTVFHNDDTQCRMYGGAAGGGKTEAILWEVFSLCNNPDFPGLKGAVFRKTVPDIEKYFVQRALEIFPANTYTYNKQKRIMKFKKTKSQVEFNYCETESDLRNYQGAEWDFLGIDEFTQHSEYVFKYLFGRCRTKKKGWTPLFFGGANPGGVGHGWVKRIFIDQELLPEEEPFGWSFIPARLEDNPAMLANNPNYEHQLMLNPDEAMRKALRYGDWNIFAGQFFTELRTDLHGFEPFEIPKSWTRVLSMDYGYDHPCCVYWGAIDEDGNLYLYRELAVRFKTYRQIAEEILDMTDEDERFEDFQADPSIWAKKGSGEGLSGAEEMQEVFDADPHRRRILMVPADNDRVIGWGIMREWLLPRKGPQGVYTKLRISNALTWWWKKTPELQRNPKKPEDALKQDMVDDPADATRYMLMGRPRPNRQQQKEQKRDRDGMPIRKPKPTRGLSIERYQKPEWKGMTAVPKYKKPNE